MQIGYVKAQEIEGGCDTSISLEPECALHPLIHTVLGFNLTQDVEKKKAEPKLRRVFEEMNTMKQRVAAGFRGRSPH